MITLAIETSCDETAVCVLETRSEGGATECRILANLIHSQIELHRHYGGVFPIMAKREHAKNIMPLLETALADAKIPLEIKTPDADKLEKVKNILQEKETELLKNLLASPLLGKRPSPISNMSPDPSSDTPRTIDRIAVTKGPGLEPALWVGVNLARSLGILWDIPVAGVNHMEGHVLGSLLSSSAAWDGIGGSASDFQKLIPAAFPALALLISGGHTELVLIKNSPENKATNENYEIVGRTKDDAAGEAFDKAARMLGLPYPGGPEISRLAEERRAEEHRAEDQKNHESVKSTITLPRPMIHSRDLDFSFSGLKTAVLYLIRELNKNKKSGGGAGETRDTLTLEQKKEIAREFEDAVADVLSIKTEKAVEKYAVQTLIAGGGVIANRHITDTLKKLAEKHSLPLLLPPPGVSGDNALMIALAGALSPSPVSNTDTIAIAADGNLSL